MAHRVKRSRGISVLRLVTLLALLAVIAVGCSSKNSSLPSATSPAITLPTTSAPAPTTPAVGTDLSGTWAGQYTGASQGTFSLTWQESGSTLNGTIDISEIGAPTSIQGTVDGNSIRFGTVGPAGITYSGTVSGNSMSGTWQSPTGNGDWTAAKSS